MNIQFGLKATPFKDQLNGSGLPPDVIRMFQNDNDALSYLFSRQIITRQQAKGAINKIGRNISQAIVQFERLPVVKKKGESHETGNHGPDMGLRVGADQRAADPDHER